MYSIKNLVYGAALSVLPLLMTGCGDDDTALPVGETAEVSLTTRGETGTVDYLLLVFDGDGACVCNRSFGSGNESIRLANGSYQFVTLSGMEGFELPASGTTTDIKASTLIPLKEGGTCSPAMVSGLEKVEISGATTYEANLQPATCQLQLKLKDAPDGVELALTNMYAGISLTNKYDNVENISSYPLNSGVNICLPTKENATLQYSLPDAPEPALEGTLDLGTPLKAGYTYSFSIQWHEGTMEITSSVTNWQLGGDEVEGDAD
ncbi:FimB/Mfa2 family fimbrial subunit [Parabacteroides timonensis]|uniref:FimB/Mfa2 family fimbrial subunit n=1 Tax=Parabacteroides timonensis TaxID=1871013 RepID=UPI00094E72FA|nr:FimB/Mfa2 family fimbrial subunit [Parabacteroides timonensis]